MGHEAAPFVLSWKTLVHSLGRRRISAPHGKLRSIFQYARRVGASELPFDDVETAIAEIAEMVVQTHADGGPVFREAEEHVLRGLNRVLSGLQGVDYLSPILELAGRQRGGVDVISLNYDLAVETAVRQTESIAVETGIGKWVPGLTVPFEMTDSQVNLIRSTARSTGGGGDRIRWQEVCRSLS